jgi:hypothetical protein
MAANVFIHPAHYYARYLVLLMDNPYKELNPALELCGLAEMDKLQLELAVSDMASPPPDFRPWDRQHAPSVKWLRQKKVYSLLHQDSAAEGMSAIVAHRRIREAIERMLIGNVSHAEISFHLKSLGYSVEEAAVADFRHFFWNTEIMGGADWAHYFREDDRGRTRDLQGQYAAARISGPQFALYRSGIKVEVDRRKVLEEVHDELYHTFLEVRALPTSEKKVEMLSTISRSLVKVTERIEAGDSALSDVLRKFEKFRMASNAEPLPTMRQLAPTGTVSDRGRRVLTTTADKEPHAQ